MKSIPAPDVLLKKAEVCQTVWDCRQTEAMDWKPIHYKDLVRPMVFPQRRDSRFVEPYDPQEENTTLKGWVRRRGRGCVINQLLEAQYGELLINFLVVETWLEVLTRGSPRGCGLVVLLYMSRPRGTN